MAESYRELFPVTKRVAYFNHAGVAPISTRVAEAVRAATRECLAWGAHRYDRLLGGVRQARESAARLLAVPPREIALVKNTSEGISFVAQGFPWKAGNAVVVPEGEFPSNLFPWLHLKRRGVRVLRVPMVEGRLRLDDFREALDQPGVRLLSVSSVEFETGFRNDLAALGQLCRDRGVFFFVDAIQSLGCLPLEPAKLGVHALAADAHKWLLGPEGVGVLWVSAEALDILEPAEIGWKSVADALDFSEPRFVLRRDAEKFEAGSFSVIALHGLGAALDLLLEVGVGAVEQRVASVVDSLARGLAGRGYRILSSREPGERSGILSFSPRTPAAGLAQRLAQRRVSVAARGPGLRLSPHFYNDESDVEKFFQALAACDG